jgi:hypothetical protein
MIDKVRSNQHWTQAHQPQKRAAVWKIPLAYDHLTKISTDVPSRCSMRLIVSDVPSRCRKPSQNLIAVPGAAFCECARVFAYSVVCICECVCAQMSVSHGTRCRHTYVCTYGSVQACTCVCVSMMVIYVLNV